MFGAATMKNLFVLCIFTALFVLPAFGQQGSADVFSPEGAHPKARALMKEDFFWSPIDESGPFGSDDGSDAAHGFYNWRKGNRSISPIDYLTDLIKSWNYPPIAWGELDTNKLKAYVGGSVKPDAATIEATVQALKQQQAEYAAKSGNAKILTDEQLRQIAINGGNGMGLTFLVGLDESIIGVAFAQIVIEGRIDPKLKYYVQRALQREMLQVITRQFGRADQQKAHEDKMRKMLFVVNHI